MWDTIFLTSFIWRGKGANLIPFSIRQMISNPQVQCLSARMTNRVERYPLLPCKKEKGSSSIGGWELHMAFCKINLQWYIILNDNSKIYDKPYAISKVNKTEFLTTSNSWPSKNL